MAQPMMHLLIADQVYAEAPGPIRSYGDFLLGSIAPDAVHMRADYTREQKRTAHFRYTSTSQISHFDPFFGQYATPENRDFVLGYLVHLLSDMIWYHTIREPFKERFRQAPSRGLSMNEAYYADSEEIEERLLWEADALRIVNGLQKGKAYSLEGRIDAGSVNAWKEKLIFHYNHRRNGPPHTQYISEQSVRDYITGCSHECCEYLEAHHMLRH